MYLNPLIGEIWRVQFQPDSICHEIDAPDAENIKFEPVRPAVVLSVSLEDIKKTYHVVNLMIVLEFALLFLLQIGNHIIMVCHGL